MNEKVLNVCDEYAIINVSVTTTLKTLKSLIDAAYVAKGSAPANIPPAGEWIQIGLTGDADIIITDGISGDGFTLSSDTRQLFPALNVSERIQLSTGTTATVNVEIFVENTK